MHAEGQESRSPPLRLSLILAEVREIHLKTPLKYGITAEQTEELATSILSFASLVTDVPEVYRHPHDPDDSAYVNLALKADARLIVSRDRHLLMLADQDRSEGKDFRSRFPGFRIVDPVELLREVDRVAASHGGPAPEPSEPT